MQVFQQISISAPLCIDYGSTESPVGEVNVYSIIRMLCDNVKSSKLDSKVGLVLDMDQSRPVCTRQF